VKKYSDFNDCVTISLFSNVERDINPFINSSQKNFLDVKSECQILSNDKNFDSSFGTQLFHYILCIGKLGSRGYHTSVIKSTFEIMFIFLRNKIKSDFIISNPKNHQFAYDRIFNDVKGF
jgi:hypothetical protein